MIDLEAVIYKHLMKNKMIDLEAITDRHLTKDKMEGKTFYEGHVVIDLYNCVEEIKRLRGEAEQLRWHLDMTRDFADRDPWAGRARRAPKRKLKKSP